MWAAIPSRSSASTARFTVHGTDTDASVERSRQTAPPR
jgi:hypothetical protein